MAKHGVDKKKLAEIAGVYPSAVTKWAKGGAIRMAQLEKIAEYFGVDVREIMPGSISPAVKSDNTQVKYWRDRAFKAEEKLKLVNEALGLILQGASKLKEAVR